MIIASLNRLGLFYISANVKEESPLFMFPRFYVWRGVLFSKYLVFLIHLLCRGGRELPILKS